MGGDRDIKKKGVNISPPLRPPKLRGRLEGREDGRESGRLQAHLFADDARDFVQELPEIPSSWSRENPPARGIMPGSGDRRRNCRASASVLGNWVGGREVEVEGGG
jgi:hypothetical protein